MMMKSLTLVALFSLFALPLHGAEADPAAVPGEVAASKAKPDDAAASATTPAAAVNDAVSVAPSAATPVDPLSGPVTPPASAAVPALLPADPVSGLVTPPASAATPVLLPADPVSGLVTPPASAAAPALLPADPVSGLVAPPASAAAPIPAPAPAVPSAPDELQVVPLYRQDELLNWIEQGSHLRQVRQDRCQLTQDIEARASVMKIPAYQFLWGDMLAWGVCTQSNAELGVQYMWDAANQGLAPALEQLGRYYWKGTLVQKDLVRAETLMREAASLGFLRARMEWAEMLLEGMGSPLDYEDAYRWLHGAVIGDKAQHQKAATLLTRLGNRMPANVVARAKAMR